MLFRPRLLAAREESPRWDPDNADLREPLLLFVECVCRGFSPTLPPELEGARGLACDRLAEEVRPRSVEREPAFFVEGLAPA